MKRMIAVLAFGVCILLLLFSGPVMDAAQDGLTLWWKVVLPTLFPFFVCATLIERSGALASLSRLFAPLSKLLRVSPYALPVLLLGGMAGYPSGARLTGMLQSEISSAEADRLGTVCNLCSPMFLLGALCTGMLGNSALFLPLLIGHYGSALLVMVFLKIVCPIPSSNVRIIRVSPAQPVLQALPTAISDGVLGLIKVGGSIVFFLVLAKILSITGILRLLCLPASFVSDTAALAAPGLLCGMLEMTGGLHMLSAAGLPLRLTAALSAYLVSFGGLCVMVQAMAFLWYERPGTYILTKLAQGVLAGLITWFVFPLLPGTAQAIAGPDAAFYMENAYVGLSLLFSSALGLSIPLLLSRVARRRKATRLKSGA